MKDVELDRQIVVRDGKGGRDRVTLLPESMQPALEEQIDRVREIHNQDLTDG